jgi:hypothetical protein
MVGSQIAAGAIEGKCCLRGTNRSVLALLLLAACQLLIKLGMYIIYSHVLYAFTT